MLDPNYNYDNDKTENLLATLIVSEEKKKMCGKNSVSKAAATA